MWRRLCTEEVLGFQSTVVLRMQNLCWVGICPPVQILPGCSEDVSDCLLVFSEEHMYWKISKFLLSHENLNMDKLPGFYQFFYSSDFQVVWPSPQGPHRL